MTSLTRILFVRHGHVHNPNQIIYGRLPGFRLSDMGEQQARMAALALRDVPVAAIFTSPLLRAQQTADIIRAELPHVPLHPAELLMEIHIEMEGQPLAVAEACNWDFYTYARPGYEQPADVLARIQAFIAEIRQTYAGQTIVAVSHGDALAFTTLWAVGQALLPLHKHALDRLAGFADAYPQPASIIMLGFTPADELPAEISYLRPYGPELVYSVGAPR